MRKALGVGITGIALALTACGTSARTSPDTSPRISNGTSSTANSDPAPRNGSALQLTFRQVTPGNDLAAMFDYDAIVQRGRVRLTVVAYEDASGSRAYPFMTVTFDGTRELIRQGNSRGYELFPDAAHAQWPGGGGPALNLIAQYLPFDSRADYWQSLCPDARQLRDGTSLGRPARQYECAKRTGGPDAIWIDDALGIALAPLVTADAKFVPDPRIDASTFSTRPPAGAKVEVFRTPLKAGDEAPAFTVTEVPVFLSNGKQAVGQPISSREFARRPYVLAFFADDILFGGAGKQVAALRDLDVLTSGGTSPAVLGVLTTPDGFVDKGGIFTSKGWHFRVASTGSRLPDKFGFGEQLGFVFVNADGTVSAVHPGVMTRTQLQEAIAGLT